MGALAKPAKNQKAAGLFVGTPFALSLVTPA
jgi:hypothetical protein